MSAPLISIITPTYNHEKYIADCIRSVLNQTYPNWEMIIIDDGSNDQTNQIISRFKDQRIKHLSQPHQGIYKLSSSYNKALSSARGEFIAILEGDDFWPADKLAVQTPFFKNQEIVMTYGNCVITNESGTELFYQSIPSDINIRDNQPIGSALKKFLMAENFIYSQTVMLRKKAITDFGGFIQPQYMHLVDFPTWCRLSLSGRFRAIPHKLGYWRRNLKSVTMNQPMTVSINFIRYINEFIRQYRDSLEKLEVGLPLKEIKIDQPEQTSQSDLSQEYAKGLTLLVYGHKKQARESFTLYLRHPEKNIFRGLISLTAIIISYTNIIYIGLSFAGCHISGTLNKFKILLLPKLKGLKKLD